jgi:small conductance mechanosensitive channel
MTNFNWNSIWHVTIILLIGVVCVLILHLGLRGVEKHLRKSGMAEDRIKRLLTLVRAGRSIGDVLILIIVLMMILYELGINITPLLASAGVAGLALSLGAQTIIKDFLGGIFILTENQFGIGDVIAVGQITGTVERITLRATYLRDSDGKLILIPNGDIRTVSNLTTQWAQAVITFNLDYEADMESTLHSLEKAIRLVQADGEIAPDIIEVPQAIGWTGFTDWAVQAQIVAKTRPGTQWMIARALRKAGLEQIHKKGIHVARPMQRVGNIS